MAIQFLTGIDLNGNQLEGAAVQNLATAPAVATFAEGQMYFNTTNNNLYVLANGAFVDLTSQGDITAVSVKATGNTASQLEIANTGGPIPEFEIITGAVADGQNYLVDSQAVFNAISASGGGTVTSVSGSGGTTGLTLTGGAITSSGTLTLGGTLIAANGGTGQTGYTIGDILYADSTTTLAKLGIGSTGQVLKVASGVPSWATDQNSGGTVTSIAFGDGLTGGTITGSGNVTLDFAGTDNYILAGTNDSGTAFEDGFKIPYSDASNNVLYGNVSDLPFTANTGTVTAVTATAPVASSGGTTPVISMAAATTSVSGYLTSTDWTTFNNKSSTVGTVTSVATGNADTITIGGTAAAPTVAANAADVSDGGNNLATGGQIYTFVTDFGYTTNVGTVTDVAVGDGLRITGTTTVLPTISVDVTTAANFILASGSTVTTADTGDKIAFSNASNAVKSITLGNIPMASLSAVKTYVDTAVAGASSFQGGYNASTNVPNLDATPTISILQGFQWAVTADGSFFTEQVRIGDLIIANSDSPTTLADWTTVQGNVDLATTSIAGIASFSADNFAVSAAGAVTIKNNGVILGTETTGDYVGQLATGTGLDNTTGTGEGSTPTVSLDFSELTRAVGEEFIMLTDGESVPKKSTGAQAASVLNPIVTHAETITANATVTHSLGTKDVIVQLYDTVTFETVYADIDRTTTAAFTVTFGATPTNSIRVLVQKIG